METTLLEAASSCSELIWGGYKNECNDPRLPSSALHYTSILVTVNDHLATSIIILILKFTSKIIGR